MNLRSSLLCAALGGALASSVVHRTQANPIDEFSLRPLPQLKAAAIGSSAARGGARAATSLTRAELPHLDAAPPSPPDDDPARDEQPGADDAQIKMAVDFGIRG